MYGPTGEDEFDWAGCNVVQWDPEKLGGRANVAGTRMFADSVLENWESGLTEQEIADSYGTALNDVHHIISFARERGAKVWE